MSISSYPGNVLVFALPSLTSTCVEYVAWRDTGFFHVVLLNKDITQRVTSE